MEAVGALDVGVLSFCNLLTPQQCAPWWRCATGVASPEPAHSNGGQLELSTLGSCIHAATEASTGCQCGSWAPVKAGGALGILCLILTQPQRPGLAAGASPGLRQGWKWRQLKDSGT